MTTTSQPAATSATGGLSPRRLNVMRLGYLFMGAGLAIVKWPLLPDAHTMSLWEGVTLCLLTAMSLLALLGLRHPATLVPVLLFEVTWKVLWLGLVAIPVALTDDLDPAMSDVAVNCSLVVVIALVVPWRHVWERYVRAPGDPWR